MEELFDLLEDSEVQEPEVMDIPERGKLPLPGVAGEKKDPALLAGNRPGIDPFQAEQSGKETFLAPDAETARKGERPGDIAALILEMVEESTAQEERLSGMPDIGKNAWEVRSGEAAAGTEGKSAPLQEWTAEPREGAAEERWYETVRERASGAEWLYLGINAPRLRGSEQGQRKVVVQMNEPEQSAPGVAVMDVRTLDRVFQRDARRYDGGLSPL